MLGCLLGPIRQVGRRKREVVGDTAAAVLLDGAVDKLLGGGRDVDRRDLAQGRLVGDGVRQVGGCESERPEHPDLNARPGDPVPDVGVLADRLCSAG